MYKPGNSINDLRIPGVHIDAMPLYIDSNSALKLTKIRNFTLYRDPHMNIWRIVWTFCQGETVWQIWQAYTLAMVLSLETTRSMTDPTNPV
jgi:hypothetical protein